jgi:hypothetical protein
MITGTNESATAVTHDSDPRPLQLLVINPNTGVIIEQGPSGSIDLSNTSNATWVPPTDAPTVDKLTGGAGNQLVVNMQAIGPMVRFDDLTTGVLEISLIFDDTTIVDFQFTYADIIAAANAAGDGHHNNGIFQLTQSQGVTGYLIPYIGKNVVYSQVLIATAFAGQFTNSGDVWGLSPSTTTGSTWISDGASGDTLVALNTMADFTYGDIFGGEVSPTYTIHTNGDETPSTPVFSLQATLSSIIYSSVAVDASGASIAANLVSGTGTQTGESFINLDFTGTPTVPPNTVWTLIDIASHYDTDYTDSAATLTGGTMDTHFYDPNIGVEWGLTSINFADLPADADSSDYAGSPIDSRCGVTFYINHLLPDATPGHYPNLMWTESYEIRQRDKWSIAIRWLLPEDTTSFATDQFSIMSFGSIDGKQWVEIPFNVVGNLVADTGSEGFGIAIPGSSMASDGLNFGPGIGGVICSNLDGVINVYYSTPSVNYVKLLFETSGTPSDWTGVYIFATAMAREI